MSIREIKKLIKALPVKDRKLLNDADKLKELIEGFGTAQRGYRLAPPGGVRQLQVEDDPTADSRSVHLHPARRA